MKARKKLFLWTIAGFGILLVIIVLGLIFSSQLVNLESIKKKIMTKVSEKTGAQVNFADADFSVFPLPHVTVRKGSFIVNKKANGSVEKISVYPEILPLFKGKVKPYRVSFSSQDITSNLPERAELKETTKTQTSINELWKVTQIKPYHNSHHYGFLGEYVDNNRDDTKRPYNGDNNDHMRSVSKNTSYSDPSLEGRRNRNICRLKYPETLFICR